MKPSNYQLPQTTEAPTPTAAPFDQNMLPTTEEPSAGKYAWVFNDQAPAGSGPRPQPDSAETAQMVGTPSGNPTVRLDTARVPAAPTERLQRLPVASVSRGPRKIGRVIISGIVGIGVLAGAAGLAARGNNRPESAEPVVEEPPITTDQAPAVLGAAPTTREALVSSTTVTSVALSPRDQAPLTTVITKAPAAEKPASTKSSSTTVKLTEAVAPEKRMLPSQEVQKIIEVTNYKGLEGHSFEIEEEFTTAAARYVIIKLNGAQAAVPISEIKASIAQSEAEAAAKPTFTSRVQLSPGNERDITFQVSPAKISSGGTDTRYIINTDESLASLMAPVKTPSADGTTLSRSGKNMNVTLLNTRSSEELNGLSISRLAVKTEIRQTTAAIDIEAASERKLDEDRPDMSGISASSTLQGQKLALAQVGREIYSNSMAYAEESARAGVPYSQYQVHAAEIPIKIHQGAKTYYFVVSKAQYDSLR